MPGGGLLPHTIAQVLPKQERTVNIQNFGAAKFRHFTIFDISAAIYFRRGVEGMVLRQML